MKRVQAWQCDYCGMTSIYKANVKRHEEKVCQKAPMACGTCKHFIPGDVFDIIGYCRMEDERLLDGKRTRCKGWEEA